MIKQKLMSCLINENMIPDEEYMFKTPADKTYNTSAVELLNYTEEEAEQEILDDFLS